MGERDERAVEVGGEAYGNILKSITNGLRAKRVLEVGTGWGYSARAFAEAMNGDGEIVTIDYIDRMTTENRDAILASGVKLTRVVSKSHDATVSGPFDILYIDGDPASAAADFARFSDTVRDGGLIIMDGYGGQSQPTDTVETLSIRRPFVTLPYNPIYSFAVHRKPLPVKPNGRNIAKCEDCTMSSFSDTWVGIDEWADDHVKTWQHAVSLWSEPRNLKYRKAPR